MADQFIIHYQECAKLSSRQRVATLKNLKYKIYLDFLFGFFGYYMIPYVLFHRLMSSLLFYNVEKFIKNKCKKKLWISSCVQTFDWYCMFVSSQKLESNICPVKSTKQILHVTNSYMTWNMVQQVNVFDSFTEQLLI